MNIRYLSSRLVRRTLTTTTTNYASANNVRPTPPAPPRLPKEEQEEYERLLKESTGPFQESSTITEQDQQHKDLRKGAKPEFEGERNPATGEVGGPKNDPLRHREWTYNGRATDF
jgi:hypothetical protein